MMPLLRPASRLAQAAGSFIFTIAVGHTLSAENISDWAVLGVVIGTATVLGGYPFRLGIFQFYPRYEAASASDRFRGHLLFFQLLTVGALLAVMAATVPFVGAVAQVGVASLVLAGRVVFELVTELLRAARSDREGRYLLSMYLLRATLLVAGAGVAVTRGSAFTVGEAFGVLAASFHLPAVFGLVALRMRPLISGAFGRHAWRHAVTYLRYTVFLTIPFLIDAGTIFVERTVYAAFVAPDRIAEYFVWSDLVRFYLNLVGLLYAFEVLPELLARNRQLTSAEHQRAKALSRFRVMLLVTAIAGGLAVAMIVHIVAPQIILGNKESEASITEFLSIIFGSLLWMIRTQILSIKFQKNRQVSLHAIIATVCFVIFGVLILIAKQFGVIDKLFYYMIIISNAGAMIFYILFVKGARWANV